MIVLPAIDLMDGKCVRLVQGIRSKAIYYEENPIGLAERYEQSGAKMIHVVDLDGAFSGQMKNIDIIRQLAKKFKIQLGGGIRDEKKIDQLLGLGISKVVLGTMLLKDAKSTARLKERYYGKIIGSFDFKKGMLSYAGWTRQCNFDFRDVADGLAEIIVTDTARDGTFAGPNLELLKSIRSAVSSRIIAAGGINNIEDLKKIKKAGINGAIIGRALLEGRIALDAIFKFQEEGEKC